MSMSKKDYETIARVIRVNAQESKVDPNASQVVKDIAADLGVALYSANPRFDYDRFMAACGFES